MIHLLAATPTTNPTGGGPILDFANSMAVPLVIVVAVMYFLWVIPKRKQDKERQGMLKEMKRGDEIQTIGGIIGKVVDPREDRVLVKVDESSNTKIWFSRGAIARVTPEDAKAAVK